MNAFALLDHPWPLDEVLVGHSEGFDVLRRFSVLQRKRQLGIVPFLDAEDLEEIKARLFATKPKTAAFAEIMSLLQHIVRRRPVGCEARPDPEPPGLTPAWKSSLKECLEAGSWRHPQIIVAETRKNHWPPELVPIILEICGQQPRQAGGERVVVGINSYETHPFATSDFDPWLLDRMSPPGRNGPQHPCRLPRPPALRDCSLEHLDISLAAARKSGWLVQGRYFFVPPDTWNTAGVNQNTWREGRAFPRQQAGGRIGFVDFEDRIWVWDNNERHWDVQLGGKNYKRINSDGHEL